MKKFCKHILVLALFFEANAISPDFKVSVFGGFVKNSVKMNDPFKTKENEDWYVENESVKSEKESADETEKTAENGGEKVENGKNLGKNEEVEAKKDTKTDDGSKSKTDSADSKPKTEVKVVEKAEKKQESSENSKEKGKHHKKHHKTEDSAVKPAKIEPVKAEKHVFEESETPAVDSKNTPAADEKKLYNPVKLERDENGLMAKEDSAKAFGGEFDIEVVKDEYFLGLGIGFIYDFSNPTYSSLVIQPSFQESINKLRREAVVLDDKISESGAKEKVKLEEKKADLEDKIEGLQKKKAKKLKVNGKVDRAKTFVNKIEIQSGILWYAGPYIGTYFGDDWAVSLGLNAILRNSWAKIHQFENGQAVEKQVDFGWNFGVMPTVKFTYFLNDRVMIFASAHYGKFFNVKLDAAKLPILGDDGQKDKKNDESDLKKHSEFHGQNDWFVAGCLGLTFLLND